MRVVWRTLDATPKGPSARSRHVLTYDQAQQCTVMFGGLDWSTHDKLNETWELRSGLWHPVHTPRRPRPRHRAAMVYDGVRHASVLFGGQGFFGGRFRDTWLYANHNWQRVRSWRKPPGRCGHALAFDRSLGLTVLFGGIGKGDRTLGDTWTFDGERWSQLHIEGPDPRRYAAFAYDPNHEGCVLQGGCVDDAGEEGLDDTWLLRHGEWYPLSSANGEYRNDHSQVYHETARLFLQIDSTSGSGDVLVLSRDRWYALETPERSECLQCSPAVWDEQLQAVVMFGGEEYHTGPQSSATVLLSLEGDR